MKYKTKGIESYKASLLSIVIVTQRNGRKNKPIVLTGKGQGSIPRKIQIQYSRFEKELYIVFFSDTYTNIHFIKIHDV
jgi:hypothetical protein